MKNLLSALSIILGLGFATAQTTTPTVKSASQQTVKGTKTVKAATAPKAEASPSAAKMKKDGTPDKRYKENKKLKKDGTPDKRYKENK